MNERIRELRKALGLTLEKFGETLGVGKTAINKIEKGTNSVTDQMFKSICREFDVNEEWLRDGTGEMFSIPEDYIASIVSNILENPTDEFYQLILDVVETYDQLQPDSQIVLKEYASSLVQKIKNRDA